MSNKMDNSDRKKEPIFFNTKTKRIIELYRNLHGFGTSCDALVDMLEESPKWNKVVEMFENVHPEASKDELGVSGGVDMRKSVEEILDE